MKYIQAPIEVETHAIAAVKRRLMPFIFVMFFFSVLDRANIAFAALTMNQELGLRSEEFGFLTGIFFVGYFLFEIPSNLLLHKLGARVWLARILVTWGVVATLGGFARNVTDLYILRFLLGVAEAGYFPGVTLYLTYWFPERERGRSMALFLIAIPIMIVIGAPVSGVILDYVHWFGISSWRWLLILEGLPPLVGGLLVFLFLPDSPADATFLSTDEREWLTAELAAEQKRKVHAGEGSAMKGLTSPRVWHLAAAYFAFVCGYYCLQFWMPLELRSLSASYSSTVVGFLLAIPSLLGLLSMLTVSASSDRRLERRHHAALASLGAGVALALLGRAHSPITTLAVLSVATMGVCAFLPPFWALPSEFVTGAAAASAIALVNSVGNLGGFAGPYLVGVLHARTGNLARSLSFLGGALIAAALLVGLLPRQSPRPEA